MTEMEDDFVGAMERRRNYDGIQLRSWTLTKIRANSNNDNSGVGNLLHSIIHTSNFKNYVEIDEQNVPTSGTNSTSDNINSSFSQITCSSRDSEDSSSIKIHLDDISLDEELIEETKTLIHAMQIPTAASIIVTELVPNTFDITDETQALIANPTDLSKFCEDIESHVINFVSEDMQELNNLITTTELGFSSSNEIKIDEECDVDESIRSISSSESFTGKIIPSDKSMHEYQPEISSSSEESVVKSQYICKITQDSSSLEERNDDNEHATGKIPNSPTVPVATMSEHKGAKRKWDKTFLCIFCGKSFTKLPRHWYMKHPNEREVSKIMSLSLKSKEKKKLIAELQNKGVALNNTNIIKTGEGSVVPKRRPRPGVRMKVKDYICCRYCNQLFLKTYIQKHERKRCSFNV